jgi:AcrR family transcriptional regulator
MSGQPARVAELQSLPTGPAAFVPAAQATTARVRIVDAALASLARQGTAKTTVDDIARGAGLSRATVYRVFPGGKVEVLAAVVDTELARLFSALGAQMGAADDLADVLVNGMVEVVTRITTHPALGYLVEYEPDVVLRHLAFDESNQLLATATRFVAPFLARWMDPEESARVAEWSTRIVLSYCICPSPDTDLTDPSQARRLVETFVLPGIRALQVPDGAAPIAIAPFAAQRLADDLDRPHHPTTTTPVKGESQ